MMSQRFIAVIFVAVTVLFCQSGGLVLNAICPYARAQHEMCHGMTHDVASHQQQRANDEAFEASDDGATCNHCVIHARNKRDDAALQETNSSQRAAELTVASALAPVCPPALLTTITTVANAHGPPRDSGLLYVRLNVFRI